MSMCSVVMVSYYSGPVLFASVKSALRQSLLAELIVVNNGNPPDVLARLQQMTLTEPRLKLITGAGNVGYTKACNAGAREASAEYLLFLNPDCLLPPDALAHSIKALHETKGAVLAGCMPRNPDGSQRRSMRRLLLTPPVVLAEAVGLTRWAEPPANEPSQPYEVASIPGAFMCIRRNDFERIGGFDEGFFLHAGGLDLCLRVRRNQGKVICVPTVKLTHMPGLTGKAPPRVIEWQNARGLMRYCHKHFGEDHVPLFLWLVDFVLLVRCFIRTTLRALKRQRLPMMSHTPAAKRLMILASGLAELPERRDWQGKTVLVTGATSQVGLCVLKRLLASGSAVLAISRADAIPFEHEHLRWLKGDLTDESLHLDGYLIDVVVHCAPIWHLPPTIDLLADAEVARIIAFSSTSIFGKALSRNTYEKEYVDALKKSEAEISQHCEARGIGWTIFRPTVIYGVGLDLGVTSLAKFIRRFALFPVYPPAFGQRHPVHADDLAIAVTQAGLVDVTINKSYNLSGGEVLTYRQMLERIFAVCHKKTRIVQTTVLPFLLDLAGWISRKKHINGEIARRMNDDLVFFHDDAARDFAFHPRPFLSGGLKDIEGF